MSTSPIGTVYLIHFHEKLCHAQHYIGFTKRDVATRIEEHANGHGARLMEVITELGLNWEVVRTWENVPKTFERNLKNYKHSKLLCPICSGRRAYNRKKGVKNG